LAASNKFYDLLINRSKKADFLDLAHKHGFNDLDLMHLLHSQLIFAFLLNMKTFKNFIVLILEDSSSNHTLGSLFGKKGLVIEKTKETGEAKRVSD
jgi:hypothetical protein